MSIPSQMRGTFPFVWQVDACGGANVLADVAKNLGVDGVIVKFADGSLAGDPTSQKFMADFTASVPVLKKQGLRVGGWIYQYLTDVDGEVEACVQAVKAGAEFLVLDGEAEIKGKNALVAEFGKKLREKLPNIPVGFSSFAIANYHSTVPFNEYAAFVDVMMPQIYWATIGWDVAVTFNMSVESYKQFGKPIAPTGQSYDSATPAGIERFVALCKQAGYEHLSWWDFQHATDAQFDAIKANLVSTPKPVVVPPAPAAPQAPAIANDVVADAWYAKAVAFAQKEGFMVGDGNGNFRPNAPMTRAEAAQVLYNFVHQK